jgi:hypothetical protein
MKRNETKKQEQKDQTQQQPIMRVESRLRAGAISTLLRGGCDI